MRRTQQTLLEQMQLGDLEILRRKELLGLNDEDLALLARQKESIEQNIDVIVDEFYERQTEIDEISLLIGDADTLMRLRTAQRKYVLDLFSGVYDSEYVNNRLRIGMVHKRIGVEPKLYLSAVWTLKAIVIRTLIRTIEDSKLLQNTITVLDKLLYFDTTLVFDTYIGSLVGEIENAKRRTELYATSLEQKVAERTQQLERLAQLDPLTEVYNQRAMQELLKRELAVAKRHHSTLAMIYFDIDEFKSINDRFGHIKGDEVLKNIGQILIKNTRDTDIPCRHGGDEFCLILPECDVSSAKLVCTKIINDFKAIYDDFSLSFGVAQTGPETFLDGNELIKLADEHMYNAKTVTGNAIDD
ncbi:MAG: GGDEF domain-containing protein [Gammaproteobacteria bacterium]|nr:GGDEF domain-containing protein [Gammaproteobacteria bacterium]